MKTQFLPKWLIAVLRDILIAGLPLLLVLANARLMMSDIYLRWEYNRPYFPDDPFGFTKEDRLKFAPLALDYLFNNEGTDFLRRQSLPNGTPLYNERELSHMDDVKTVTQGLLRFGTGLAIVYILCVILLATGQTTRPGLYDALFKGSILTLGLIVIGLAATALSFDWLFTQFHALFFEGESWIFPYSDTLIRLFPTRFWIDAFVLTFGGVLIEALLLGGAMWWKLKRGQAATG